MRKTYYTDIKGKKLRQAALLQLRQTRNLIDPALLAKVRGIIEGRVKTDIPQGKPAEGAVDQKKNLAIVLKFLELKPNDEALHKQVRALLSERTYH